MDLLLMTSPDPAVSHTALLKLLSASEVSNEVVVGLVASPSVFYVPLGAASPLDGPHALVPLSTVGRSGRDTLIMKPLVPQNGGGPCKLVPVHYMKLLQHASLPMLLKLAHRVEVSRAGACVCAALLGLADSGLAAAVSERVCARWATLLLQRLPNLRPTHTPHAPHALLRADPAAAGNSQHAGRAPPAQQDPGGAAGGDTGSGGGSRARAGHAAGQGRHAVGPGGRRVVPTRPRHATAQGPLSGVALEPRPTQGRRWRLWRQSEEARWEAAAGWQRGPAWQ